MTGDIGFFEAVQSALTPLAIARRTLALIERAEREGALALLRDGADVADVAGRTGWSEETATSICRALVANGVAEPDSAGFRLTPPWRALTAEGTFIRLRDFLIQGRVIDRMLSTGEDTYPTLSPGDRSAFARAVSPNPFADELVDRMSADLSADPWWNPMRAGGRYLEYGCGLAGRMLTILRASPSVRAVGIEIDPQLADEARARATALGLNDRVDVITADATTYRSDDAFDFGFWSQWFFPAATRPAALSSMYANLRSGGVLRTPVFGDHARMAEAPSGQAARLYTLDRVMLDSWGVPERTPQALAAEVEEAGFVDVAIERRDIAMTVYARRP